MLKETDAVVVSWDFSKGIDDGVMLIGHQDKNQIGIPIMNIVNAIKGQEAYDIFRKLGEFDARDYGVGSAPVIDVVNVEGDSGDEKKENT